MKECCGNCKNFKYEDTTGQGWCKEQSWLTRCDKTCKCFEKDLNGWVEITPDNVEVIKNVEKRVVIANYHRNIVLYRSLHDVNGLYSMANQGGYY